MLEGIQRNSKNLQYLSNVLLKLNEQLKMERKAKFLAEAKVCEFNEKMKEEMEINSQDRISMTLNTIQKQAEAVQELSYTPRRLDIVDQENTISSLRLDIRRMKFQKQKLSLENQSIKKASAQILKTMKEKMQRFEHDMNGPVSERQKMIREIKNLQNQVQELKDEIRDREEKSQFEICALQRKLDIAQHVRMDTPALHDFAQKFERLKQLSEREIFVRDKEIIKLRKQMKKCKPSGEEEVLKNTVKQQDEKILQMKNIIREKDARISWLEREQNQRSEYNDETKWEHGNSKASNAAQNRNVTRDIGRERFDDPSMETAWPNYVVHNDFL